MTLCASIGSSFQVGVQPQTTSEVLHRRHYKSVMQICMFVCVLLYSASTVKLICTDVKPYQPLNRLTLCSNSFVVSFETMMIPDFTGSLRYVDGLFLFNSHIFYVILTKTKGHMQPLISDLSRAKKRKFCQTLLSKQVFLRPYPRLFLEHKLATILCTVCF